MNGVLTLARRHKFVAGAAVALAVFALAMGVANRCSIFGGCGPAGIPSGLLSYRQVKARAEAQLYYPGAQVLLPFGGGEDRNAVEGVVNAAFAGAVLRVNAPSQSIYRWYQDWMTSHGWKSSPTIRATTQLSIEGYARGQRERFSVAMDDASQLGQPLGQQIPPGQGTVFEIRYMILTTPALRLDQAPARVVALRVARLTVTVEKVERHRLVGHLERTIAAH